MEEKPNYYAIIPAEIRYDQELKPSEKLLYGEITALASKTGTCWANNEYFSDLYDTTPRTIARWIRHLKAKKYIFVKYEYKKNTKEIAKRIIKIGGDTNVSTYGHKCHGGGDTNVLDNNTSINNTRKKEIYKERIKILPKWFDKVYESEINEKEKKEMEELVYEISQ